MTETTDINICPFCGKGRLRPEYERNGIPEYYTCTNCLNRIPYSVQMERFSRKMELSKN